MTLDEFMTLILMLLAMAFLLGGLAMMFIGGLVLMSVKCVVFGGPILLFGFALWFAADRS